MSARKIMLRNTANRFLPPIFVLGLITILTNVCGCRPVATTPDRVATRDQIRVYSEDELRRLILPGMTEFEVTNLFGPTPSQIDSSNVVTMIYSFAINTNAGSHLAGFTIKLIDKRVVGWSPIIGHSFSSSETASSSAEGGYLKEFQFFTVQAAYRHLLGDLEAGRTPPLSEIPSQPDLVITAQTFVGKLGNEKPETESVALVINANDMTELKRFSERNIDQKILIGFDGRIIASPVISTPLTFEKIVFPVRNVDVLNKLRRKNSIEK